MQKLVSSLAALALTAGPALAGGDIFAAQPTNGRPVTCYVKLIGSGSFVTDRLAVSSAVVDSMGQNGLGIGGQLGCDVTKGNWLAGLFVDGVYNKASVDVSMGGLTLLHIPFSAEYSVGGRLGVFATPSTLLYGLAAYTWATESASMVGVPLHISNPTGVAIGGGIETTLNQYLVLSLEYRHVGFDTQSSGIIPMKIDTTDNNVRAGVGIRF